MQGNQMNNNQNNVNIQMGGGGGNMGGGGGGGLTQQQQMAQMQMMQNSQKDCVHIGPDMTHCCCCYPLGCGIMTMAIWNYIGTIVLIVLIIYVRLKEFLGGVLGSQVIACGIMIWY